MQATIGASTARTWKEVKAHYLIAAGAAMAIAAVAATGGWQLSTAGGGSAAVGPRPASVSVAPVEPNYTYYLVASQAQADRVLAMQDEAALVQAANRDFGRREEIAVFIADDEASLDFALREVMHTNHIRFGLGLSEVKLVDLRAGAK